MLSLLLKRFVPLPKLTEYETYLFIGPHPDDIEVACAPTVKRLTDAGKTVHFLIVTDGRMGAVDPALSGDALVEIRSAEARASAELLGASSVTFLPFHDAGDDTAENVAKAILSEIVRLKPQVIFAPDPDVISECHPDHIKVGKAAKTAFTFAPFPPILREYGIAGSHAPSALAFYYTDRPNAYIDVSKTFGAREKALRLFPGQFTSEGLSSMLPYFRLRAMRFGLRRLCPLADGYRALSPVHAHCFPEASLW